MREISDEIINKLPIKVARAIQFLPDDITKEICEIRMRKNHFVTLTTPYDNLFLLDFGGVSKDRADNCVLVSKEDIDNCFIDLCNRSVYAHADEIKEGYINIGKGCRAGITGSFYEGAATEIYSINIRIARQVENCGDRLIPFADKGLLISGPPGSGKTTLLRDAVTQLSKAKKRVCVVDTRGEIAADFDLGDFADIITAKDKAKGAEMALRTMNPQIIAFDEIGSLSELKSVTDMLNAGVSVITTAHTSSAAELIARPVTAKLLSSGAIKYVAILSASVGEEFKIVDVKEIIPCR